MAGAGPAAQPQAAGLPSLGLRRVGVGGGICWVRSRSGRRGIVFGALLVQLSKLLPFQGACACPPGAGPPEGPWCLTPTAAGPRGQAGSGGEAGGGAVSGPRAGAPPTQGGRSLHPGGTPPPASLTGSPSRGRGGHWGPPLLVR